MIEETPGAKPPVFPEWLTAALDPRYRLEGLLGQGATATVYVALDTERERRVAIKVLGADLSEMTGERFLREIRFSASLQHPNILPLFDSGSAGTALYYVMPYVEGATLKERLVAEGPLPISEVVSISAEIADALDHAHRQGIVHRDIKPGNILLSEGHAIVSDFGIASAVTVAGGDRLTRSGLVIGTPTYMSPEQASGGDVDERTDLYSLGCLLFEMLVGEPPFTGRTAQAVLAKQMVEYAPSMPNLRPGIPEHLDGTVRSLMAKVPADRPRSAAVAKRLIEGEEMPPPSSPGQRPASADGRGVFLRRRIGGAVLIAALAVGTWWAVGGRGPSPPSIDAHRVLVFPPVQDGRAALGSDGFLAASLVGTALETATDITWQDGWSTLGSRDREGFALLSPDRYREAARAAGAGWSISGSLRAVADSTLVSLELQDASGDSLVARATESVPTDPDAVAAATAAATAALFGYLTEDTIQAMGLLRRPPAALAANATGHLAYRRSRFDESFEAFTKAVEIDSTFAAAAVGGAVATLWLHQPDVADSLLDLAERHREELPVRYHHLGTAVGHFWHGAPDSALAVLDSLTRIDPDWGLASSVRAEVFYHLMPSVGPADSLAEHWFRQARDQEPGLTPPLFHLTEIVVRRGDLTTADSMAQLFATFDPDSTYARRLEIMLDCVGERGESVDWTAMLATALQLAVAGRQPRCAERALKGVLGASQMPRDHDHRWGAFFALQALYVSQGRDAEAIAIIDSSTHAGSTGDLLLYVLDTMAGADMEEQARDVQAIADERYTSSLDALSPLLLWLFGSWYEHVGDSIQLIRYTDHTRTLAEDTGDAQVTRYAQALEGHLMQLRGDTAAAIQRFRSLHPVVNVDELEWSYGEAFPVERLELARMLLARGEASEAYEVARSFDHPAPIIHLAFLPASLAVRHEAARVMERPDLAREARERLLRLGREDLLRSQADVPVD